MNMVEKALLLLETIQKWNDNNESINTAIRTLDPSDDFCTKLQMLPAQVESCIVALLDDIFEDATGSKELASYYLYDCQSMKSGGKIVDNGKEYQIKTIDDLRKYITASVINHA